ncbi:MAG: F-box protein [Proteobacteria bacterium]|nr:F-box protein [Pseudomonadota bacterium]
MYSLGFIHTERRPRHQHTAHANEKTHGKKHKKHHKEHRTSKDIIYPKVIVRSDNLATLPADVLRLVFSVLTFHEILSSIVLVCKSWRSVSSCCDLSRNYFISDRPAVPVRPLCGGTCSGSRIFLLTHI